MHDLTEAQIEQYKADALQYIIPHFASNALLEKGPMIFTHGEGCYLYDIDGKRYFDTFASLLTTICGHRCRTVDDAIRQQLERLEFFPNYENAFTIPLIQLAKRIGEIMPGDLGVSFFVNSGSEANETALKMARQYHRENGQPWRFKMIARRQSYHATTLGASSVTGLSWFREYFDPLLPGCIFAPEAREDDGGRSFDELRRIVDFEKPESISCVIMDPIPGSNTGYPMPPEGYMTKLRQLCDETGILLIFDEVQTGFGKTGKWFACEHFGIEPDIMTIGKGFTGGYIPLGAAVTTPKVAGVFRRGAGTEFRSGSTYGGHTIACAATLANIEVIQKNGLVERAARMGDYLGQRLHELSRHAVISNVSGIGLLRAVNMKPEYSDIPIGAFVRDWAYEHGLILRANGNILVLAPALIITEEQIDWVVGQMDHAIGAAVKHFDL
jgi:adenosylmethionine-8-amino-7-oxononanoate aminotransferase